MGFHKLKGKTIKNVSRNETGDLILSCADSTIYVLSANGLNSVHFSERND